MHLSDNLTMRLTGKEQTNRRQMDISACLEFPVCLYVVFVFCLFVMATIQLKFIQMHTNLFM